MPFFSNTSPSPIQLTHLRREVLILVEACRPDLFAQGRRAQTKNVAWVVVHEQPADLSIQDLADCVLDTADRIWVNEVNEHASPTPAAFKCIP